MAVNTSDDVQQVWYGPRPAGEAGRLVRPECNPATETGYHIHELLPATGGGVVCVDADCGFLLDENETAEMLQVLLNTSDVVPECDPAAAAEGKRRMLDAVAHKFHGRITRLERREGVAFNVRQGGNCERIEEPVEGCFDVYGFREGVMLRVYREPGMVIEMEVSDG